MSTAAALPAPPAAPSFPRVVISEQVTIPSDVIDLDTFSRWVCSEQRPPRGNFSFLNGTIWVDLSLEELYTHNLVRGEIYHVLGNLVELSDPGRFIPLGMILRNHTANFSTEPDGMFVSYQAFQSGQMRQVQGDKPGIYELEGSPEMVLEVVGETTWRRDVIELRQLYYRAGIQEYWLVDVRDLAASRWFWIFRPGTSDYVATRRQAGGWLRSAVFGRSFRLTHEPDPLGQPMFTLEVR